VRRSQAQFHAQLLKAYGHRCAISGWGPPAVLEGAHINPHAESGINSLDNGLLLRADLHSLFDQGLLPIDPETLEILIDDELHETEYSTYHRQRLRTRSDSGSARGATAAGRAARICVRDGTDRRSEGVDTRGRESKKCLRRVVTPSILRTPGV
jgi:hypothetical protein